MKANPSKARKSVYVIKGFPRGEIRNPVTASVPREGIGREVAVHHGILRRYHGCLLPTLNNCRMGAFHEEWPTKCPLAHFRDSVPCLNDIRMISSAARDEWRVNGAIR